MRLTDRVAILTGAGSGIGAASALAMAAEGARVLVADVNESRRRPCRKSRRPEARLSR